MRGPEAVRAAGTPVEVWFQDEARVGQQGTSTYVWAEKGSRPRAPKDLRHEWACMFGAVRAERGVGAALVLPHANTQAPGQPQAEAVLGLIEDHAPAAVSQEAAADSDPVQPDRDPVSSADETAQSVPAAGASVPAKPAAHWDRTTDRVQFNWPAVERVAPQDSPNQGMAKLLVAARAEGARSRWPF